MISNGALEDAVITLLCYSDEHSALLALRVPPDLFTSKINQIIATTALDHIRRYSGPPKGQLEYLLEMELQRGEAGKLLGNQLDSIASQAKEIQPAFILDQLDRFLEIQSTTKALGKALESLQTGDVEEARAHIANARGTPAQKGSSGIWLNNPEQALAFLDKQNEEGFSSGVQAIDKIGSTPARKTLTLFIAPPSRGKSWWCIALGCAAVQHHLKVIHITLENSEDMVSKRYLQALYSLSTKEAKEVNVTLFGESGMSNQKITRPSIESQRDMLSRNLRKQYRQLPFIKEYPSGYLTLEELDLWLDDFARQPKGFNPDLLIIDYGDLMSLSIKDYRLDIGHLTVGLRGQAVKRNCAVCTPVQSNVEGEKAHTVRRRHAAENWGRIGTADNVYTYSQTDEEFKLGLARISLEKSRNERDRYMVLLSQRYEVGQFCIDSILMKADITTQLDAMTSS